MKFLNNLFYILNKDEDYCKIKLASKEHEVFKAHFKDNEVLPGFLQIDLLKELFSHEISSIIKAKFIKIIKPEDIITYNISTKNKKKYKAIIKKDDTKMSEIIYETK